MTPIVARIGIAALAATLVPGPPAAGAPEPDLTGLSIEELMEVEIPSVYSASAFDQKVTDAPASVTIITAEEIARHGYRTLADVLEGVRGFYVSNDRNYAYLGTRGFSRPGDYNSRVLLLLDGHRLNDGVYGSAAIGTEQVFDLAIVDRIEVVRGPSSSLYGTEAFFGVVNVVTKRGPATHGAAISAQAGSWGSVGGGAQYGWARGSGPELFVSATGLEADGQRLHYPEFDTSETNNGFADGCDRDRYGRFFGRINFGGFTVETVHSSRTKRIPTGSYGTVFNDPRNQTTDAWSYLVLSYGADVGGRFHLDARTFFNRYRYDGRYVYDVPPVVINRDEAAGDAWGGRLAFSGRVRSKHTLVAGAEYRSNDRQDQANFDEDPFFSYLDSRRDNRTIAAFLQDEFQPSPRWIVNLGLRFDHIATFGGTTNPRVAVIWKPDPSTALKGLYGKAFRAPNAFELYYADGFSQKGSGELDPETISTYEIVLERFTARGLRLSGSAFHYTIDDLISLQTDPADDLIVFRNADRVESHGLEVEVVKAWARGSNLRASYMLQSSEDARTRAVLTNSPRHLAKLNLSEPWFGGRLVGGLEAQYTSARATLGGDKASGFGVVNVTLLGRNVVKGLDISLSAYNLLDEVYGDPGSEEHIQDVIPQDGRSWRLKIDYRF